MSVARLSKLKERYDFSVEWKPFLLGPIFKDQGWNTSPFVIYPAKGEYMWRDIERLCDKHKISFNKPSIFPQNGLLMARIALAASKEAWLDQFILKCFEANFVYELDISQTSVVESIFNDLGVSLDWIERGLAAENKQKLREQTQKAKDSGIFGVPSFVVNNDVFWGDDRLEDALKW